jgi:hypothetical protein
MSAWTCRLIAARPTQRLFRLVLEPHEEGPGADSEEKHEPACDIDTGPVDSLKAPGTAERTSMHAAFLRNRIA